MADFCQQCSKETFGEDMGDFKRLGADDVKLEPGHGWMALCEGCGPTVVDNDGKCISHFCEVHGEENRKNVVPTDAGSEG